jgi:hypothetical protein
MPTRKPSVPAPASQAPRAHPHHVRHVDQDAGDAFVPDYRKGFVASRDGDAEAFGEEFIAAATSAEPVAEDARDEVVADELAGLSVESVDEEENE